MKRLLKLLVSLTLWCGLAAFAGAQIGYEQGYRRGVRDIGSLLIELHDAAGSPPGAPTKRGIMWGQP